MSDFRRLVGEQLRMIRKNRGFTQAQVAEKTGKEGMSKSHISDIERGRKNISLDTLDVLMNALEIAPNELFNFHELNRSGEIGEKKLLLDLHKQLLMERPIEDVRYVVRTARDFLDTVDHKVPKRDAKQ
ncbi:helix-turn-helix domain-containing protein [Paenibacillus cymbidii]|uniref:helix-turn-helix domain-containing protein n=1 Tax=Paenibacillus cymbidii TaxID=1639034 RepID=UPI0010815131|nr:helix-turn-helix transcriptional regulator [Paenibacillus cymbidii]